MKYFVVSFFLMLSALGFSQTSKTVQSITGTVFDDKTKKVLPNVNIININTVKGTVSDSKGKFELEAAVNDTLHITSIGFLSLKVRVTNDWIKNKTATIELTEKVYVLDEVVVGRYKLTGYLDIDSKLIPSHENYRYSINGLNEAYETGDTSPNAFNKVLKSMSNPADALYNFFGKKPKELKRLKEIKNDETVQNLLGTKYDREAVAVLLGIEKERIPEILSGCNFSESFIATANDLQILDAIKNCYEEYKVLKKK